MGGGCRFGEADRILISTWELGCGMGEPAWLLLACISLNAATETRWEVSEATLSPLGRGRAGGRSSGIVVSSMAGVLGAVSEPLT